MLRLMYLSREELCQAHSDSHSKPAIKDPFSLTFMRLMVGSFQAQELPRSIPMDDKDFSPKV